MMGTERSLGVVEDFSPHTPLDLVGELETTGEAQQVPQIACTPEGDYWPLALRIDARARVTCATSVPSCS